MHNMEAIVSLLSLLLVTGVAGGRSHANLVAAAAVTPSRTMARTAYWQAVLPDTPMPLAIHDMLTKSTEHRNMLVQQEKAHTIEKCQSQRSDLTKIPRKIGQNSNLWKKVDKYGLYENQKFMILKGEKNHNILYGPQGEDDSRKITAAYGTHFEEDPRKVTTSYGTEFGGDLSMVTAPYGSEDDSRKLTLAYGSKDKEDPKKITMSYQSLGEKDLQGEDNTRKIRMSYGSQDEKDPKKITMSYGSKDKEDPKKTIVSYEPQRNKDPRKTTVTYGFPNVEDPRKVTTTYGSEGDEEPRKNIVMHVSQGEQDQRKITMTYVSQGDESRKITMAYGSHRDENPSKGERHAHIHSDNDGSKMLADVFFFHDTLRPGSVITPTIPPTTSLPALLPRRIADSLPFSTERFADIVAMLAPASLVMAGEIRWTLNTCEHPRPLPGEKAGCADSLESLVDLPAALLGTRNVRAFSADIPTDPAGTAARRGTYNVTAVRKLSAESPEIATCHDLTYPYAVFFCHTASPAVAYAVTLEAAVEASAAPAMEVLAVCHLDTSQWSPKNPFFVAHNLKPGDAAACHFLSKLSIVWVPADAKQVGASEAEAQ